MIDHTKQAINILKEGGVVIFPTDTAFGIGCRMDDEDAVKKVFSTRKRPVTQAVPVLFSSIVMVRKYVIDISPEVESLTNKYWPGALTVILKANIKSVPSLVRGGGLAIGTRIPRHETAKKIITEVGIPIIGPSANFHGEKTPYTMADIDPRLYSLVDYIVPGTCSIKKESTVIDCTTEPWKIIRNGAILLNL